MGQTREAESGMRRKKFYMGGVQQLYTSRRGGTGAGVGRESPDNVDG